MYVSNAFRVKDGEPYDTAIYTLDAEKAISLRLEKVIGESDNSIYASQTLYLPASEWIKLISEIQKELRKNGYET